MKEKIKEYFYKIEDFDVKIFGGAAVLTSLYNKREISIGKMNADVAFQMLKEAGFKIVSYDIGGNFGRRIIFNTANGEVLVKKLRGIPDYSDLI
jgi:chemotaxis protein CheD